MEKRAGQLRGLTAARIVALQYGDRILDVRLLTRPRQLMRHPRYGAFVGG